MQSLLRSSAFRQPVLGAGAGSIRSQLAFSRSPAFKRTYATESNPGRPFGNAPLYLSALGLGGIAYYLYVDGTFSGEKKPAKAPAVPLTSALDKDNFVDFTLKNKKDYNHNTSIFTFALPENTATLLPVAGLVLVKPSEEGPKDEKGNPVVRPYTPISPGDTPGEVSFLIKKYDSGKLTPYIHELKVGDKLGIKGPMKKIEYKPNEFDQVAMIAGGSGITPMYQVLDHALKLKDDKTKFTLIFANVSPADILLKDEFENFKKSYPDRFEPVFVVDKADDKWSGYTGYVTKDLIEKHVKGPSEKVKIYVCGPPGQMKAISGPKKGMQQGELGGVLKELGYTEEQVFKF